jgi:hypothetical protein
MAPAPPQPSVTCAPIYKNVGQHCCIPLNVWRMSDVLDRVWKEAILVYSRYYPGICLNGLRQNTKFLSHDRRCPGWDSNRRSHEYTSTGGDWLVTFACNVTCCKSSITQVKTANRAARCETLALHRVVGFSATPFECYITDQSVSRVASSRAFSVLERGHLCVLTVVLFWRDRLFW